MILSALLLLQALTPTTPVQVPVGVLPTVVTTTADSGIGSLRQAILNANSNNNSSTISFAIAGVAPFVISPTTALPGITASNVTVDGTSEPGYNGAPLIEIDNELNGVYSLIVGTSNVVKGLSFITDTATNVDHIFLSDGSRVSQCYLGVRPDGITPQKSYFNNASVNARNNCIIGGPSPSDRNLSGPSTYGIFMGGDHNTVQNNWVGLDASGTKALISDPIVNFNVVDDGICVFGGTGNVIENNVSSGTGQNVYIHTGTNTLIQNNLIGPNASGTGPISGQAQGIQLGIFDGGTGTKVLNNVVVGCDNGIYSAGTNPLIEDNLVGLLGNGAVLGNNTGVYVDFRSSGTVIKASTPGSQIISGNGYGVYAVKPATLKNNYFGLGAVGHGPAGNAIDVQDYAGNLLITNNLFTATFQQAVILTGNDSLLQGNMFGVGIGGSNRESPNIGTAVVISGVRNRLTKNTFYKNSGGSIRLESGGNNNQTAPQINFSAGPQLNGTLTAAPNTGYTIEFFKLHTTSTNTNGMSYIGGENVTTDGTGAVAFTFNGFSGTSSDSYAATATDPVGNTSQFSVPRAATITFSSPTIEGSKSLKGILTLSTGPIDPISLSLTSDNGNAVVPGGIAVSVGQNSVSFSITTKVVGAVQVANISSGTASAPLTIQPPHLIQLLTVPASVQGGQSSTGRYVLDIAPPTGGVVAAPTTGNSLVAAVPTSNTATGQIGSYAITTSPVSQDTAVTMGIAFNGQNLTQVLNVLAARPATISVSPNALFPGQSSTGTVKLTGAGGPQGNVVNLSVDNTAVGIPATATVAAGMTTVTFPISLSAISSSSYATLTATANGISKTCLLKLNVPALIAVTTGGSVGSGLTGNGQVVLNSSVSSSVIVALSSNSNQLTLPTSATVSMGTSFGTYGFTAPAVDTPLNVIVTAQYNGASVQATLQVVPALLQKVLLSPATVTSGQNTLGTVVLYGIAGPNGVTISLSSDDASVTVPSTLFIPNGHYYGYFPVRTTAGHPTTAHIKAVYNTSISTTLTVQ